MLSLKPCQKRISKSQDKIIIRERKSIRWVITSYSRRRREDTV